jgi:small subunit ribosomal protein S18
MVVDERYHVSNHFERAMPRIGKRNKFTQKKKAKQKVRGKKKDPLIVDGRLPRPMFVDYKDVELLRKLTSRQGKILSRRKSGCSAVSQHAVATAIKRARFMALLPYKAD